MKRLLIRTIIFCSMFCIFFHFTGNQFSFADDKSKNVVYETSYVSIIKENNKYGVIDNKTKEYIVKPVLDKISAFSRNNDFEYKIQSDNMLGYMNLVTKDSFLSYFDNISIINDKYLKVEKEGKVGVTSKSGKIIVPPEYQKVAVTSYDGVEYIITQQDKKYNVFYNDGKLITPEDFQNLDDSSLGAEIMKYLNPALKEYRLEIQKKNKEVAYVAEADNLAQNNSENLKVDENDLSTNNDIEVQDFPLPPNVKKISVKQEDYVQEQEESENTNEALDILTLNNKSFYIVNNNGKLGLQNKNGKEIIPSKYNILQVKLVNNKDVIAAISDNNIELYNEKGQVIAKKFNGAINIFTSFRKYEYYQDDNIYKVGFNNKKIGEIEVFNDGTYNYQRFGFNASNMKKANEIFATYVNMSK